MGKAGGGLSRTLRRQSGPPPPPLPMPLPPPPTPVLLLLQSTRRRGKPFPAARILAVALTRPLTARESWLRTKPEPSTRLGTVRVRITLGVGSCPAAAGVAARGRQGPLLALQPFRPRPSTSLVTTLPAPPCPPAFLHAQPCTTWTLCSAGGAARQRWAEQGSASSPVRSYRVHAELPCQVLRGSDSGGAVLLG